MLCSWLANNLLLNLKYFYFTYTNQLLILTEVSLVYISALEFKESVPSFEFFCIILVQFKKLLLQLFLFFFLQ